MFHQEITIPVNADKRNFEQRRKDLLNNIESSVSTSAVSKSSKSISTSSATSNKNENKSLSLLDSEDDLWDHEVKQWLTKSRSGWDDEISRIKKSFFRLEPMESDLFDQKSIGDSSSSYTKKMSSTVVTSSTKDGQTTSQSSQSFYSSSSDNDKNLNQSKNAAITTGNSNTSNLIEKSNASNLNSTLTSTDYFKDAYELSDDKHVHFKIRIEAEGFKPEDIKVTAHEDKVEIKAKKVVETANKKSSSEFSKTISVPPSVDIKKFQCHQTQDGILILEAPLKQENTKAISITNGLGMRATSDSHSTFSNALVQVTGKAGPVVINDATYGKKIHLEIPVDKDYLPSDFTVYTDLNKIHIKGRHETKTANSSSFKEFSRYYEVPETLDPMSVSFHLLNGTLVVEAPLSRTAA